MDLKSMMGQIGKSDLFGSPAPLFPATDPLKFDDAGTCAAMNLAYPKQIDSRQGVLEDGLAVHYGHRSLKHGSQGGSPNQFRLSEGQRIVRVEGSIQPLGRRYDHGPRLYHRKETQFRASKAHGGR